MSILLLLLHYIMPFLGLSKNSIRNSTAAFHKLHFYIFHLLSVIGVLALCKQNVACLLDLGFWTLCHVCVMLANQARYNIAQNVDTSVASGSYYGDF